MKLKLKDYKILKIKSGLKHNDLIFIYHSVNVNNKSWVIIEQELVKFNLIYYKIYNKLFIKSIKPSVFKNVFKNADGPILFSNIKYQKKVMPIKNLINITPKLCFLCLKLKNKVYTISQIKSINNLKFVKNALLFNNVLRVFIKNLFVFNFLLINKKLISK